MLRILISKSAPIFQLEKFVKDTPPQKKTHYSPGTTVCVDEKVYKSIEKYRPDLIPFLTILGKFEVKKEESSKGKPKKIRTRQLNREQYEEVLVKKGLSSNDIKTQLKLYDKFCSSEEKPASTHQPQVEKPQVEKQKGQKKKDSNANK